MDRAEWAEGRVCREVGRVGGAVCGRVGAFDQGACEFGGRWAACGWVGRLTGGGGIRGGGGLGGGGGGVGGGGVGGREGGGRAAGGMGENGATE